MKYTLPNSKIINIPDKDLENLQKILEISKEEAIHTWLVDNEYENDAEADELTEKARKNGIMHTIHGAKAQNKEKKERKPREKKANPLKREIIDTIYTVLNEKYGATVTNTEKYIDFSVDGLEFTVNLVQHRAKKGN